MTRGTTPEIVCTVKGTDLDNLSELYVTIKQGKTIVEKSIDEVLIDKPRIHIMLTQEETLSFSSGRDASIQVRGLTNEGEAWATNIVSAPVQAILKDGVIE